MSPFRQIARLPPESQNRQSAEISRVKATLNGPVSDRRASSTRRFREVRHATKHTAKFEPAAWSWAQMTSGSGAPKHILSEEAITFKHQPERPNRST